MKKRHGSARLQKFIDPRAHSVSCEILYKITYGFRAQHSSFVASGHLNSVPQACYERDFRASKQWSRQRWYFFPLGTDNPGSFKINDHECFPRWRTTTGHPCKRCILLLCSKYKRTTTYLKSCLVSSLLLQLTNWGFLKGFSVRCYCTAWCKRDAFRCYAFFSWCLLAWCLFALCLFALCHFAWCV